MSDWQFAAKEGNLRWTSPALPEKGQVLYTVLSPTLLLGYSQQGDLLPVDYVKLTTVRTVSRTGNAGVELERDGGIGLLLVADTNNSAEEWFSMINVAMKGQDIEPVSGVPASSRGSDPSPAPVQPQHQYSARGEGGYTTTQTPAQKLNLAGAAPSQSGEYNSLQPQSDNRTDRQIHNLQGTASSHDDHQHEFRPLNEVMSNGESGGAAKAQTTTYTTHEQVRPGAGPNSRPLPSSSMPGASPVPHSTSNASMTNDSTRLRHSRPMDSYGGFAASPANQPPVAPAAGPNTRARSGMMIRLPATQTVNRNIAPNLSAMWKEWEGPDGTTYLLFEPTGAMLRRARGESNFEMYVEGSEALTEEQLNSHPYAEGSTVANLNAQSVRNLQSYGSESTSMMGPNGTSREVTASSVYRAEVVASPRGQFSPSRHAKVSALASPRVDSAGYAGRRVHRVSLGVNRDEPMKSVIQHEVEALGSHGLEWDPATGEASYADGSRSLGPNGPPIGPGTLHKQWEEVRSVLMRGRYFKKHALRTNTSQFRTVFLTSDNAYVCAVPTSAVLQNATRDPSSFANVTETVQYYGPDTKAIPVNTIQHISMGTEEDFVYRRKTINPEATFCIVSKTHAFVLECKTKEEAEYFADAWTFFLLHSKPINPKKKRTPQMIAPVTHGTRTGVRF